MLRRHLNIAAPEIHALAAMTAFETSNGSSGSKLLVEITTPLRSLALGRKLCSGVNLFVAMGIANVSLEAITKAVVPYLWMLFFMTIVLTALPSISLWLPKLLL